MKKLKLLKHLMVFFLLITFMCTSVITPSTSIQAAKNITIKSIKLNKETHTIKKGEKLKLKATITPSNASKNDIIWTTSDNSIATVSKKGVVTAKKNGTTAIIATT